MLTAFGAAAATTMVVSYALEDRHRQWIAVFAAGVPVASPICWNPEARTDTRRSKTPKAGPEGPADDCLD
jgi:hypothetical protein